MLAEPCSIWRGPLAYIRGSRLTCDTPWLMLSRLMKIRKRFLHPCFALQHGRVAANRHPTPDLQAFNGRISGTPNLCCREGKLDAP